MPTPFAPTQEIRLGLVMYGGVSLAIYMNGVVQELLRLVRATAPRPGTANALLDEGDARFDGSTRVYRQLGQMLAYGEAPNPDVGPDTPIRTRFVIDVLSGTSAGGINAVFLAKALVNDQELEELKKLWVSEGDIHRLLNDAQSVRDIAPMRPSDPPRSLLNGRRMYLKLLAAFRGMGEKSGSGAPLVNDLDLFVTTTDVHGAEIKLRLADRVVEEKRHKRVFHFRYRSDQPGKAAGGEHFSSSFNPILAFAARCTSAFPFAFEPMTALAAQDVLRQFRRPNEKQPDAESLAGVLSEDERTALFDPEVTEPIDFANRAFTDGGYLDNKPFQHAIGALDDRRASLPVDRKLIYVEPSPEIMGVTEDTPPDALENVRAALLGVPRYETIREDLQAVLKRNQLAHRVSNIIDGLEQDLVRTEHAPSEHSAQFAELGLEEMIEQYGVAYGGYHRLKVSALTDELAEIVGNALRLDLKSDHFRAVRTLVKAWREGRYTEYSTNGGKRNDTYNKFLLDFDVAFRQRRLDFLRSRIDLLGCGGDRAMSLLKGTVNFEAAPGQELDAELRRVSTVLRNELEPMRSELVRLRRLIAELSEEQKDVLRSLDTPIPDDSLPQKEWKSPLELLLDQPTQADQLEFAHKLLDRPVAARAGRQSSTQRATIDALAESIAQRVKDGATSVSGHCWKLWDNAHADTPEGAARCMLKWFYERFETYDHAAYPVLYATNLGDEHDPIDVIRISPVDATSLSSDPNRLAGLSLAHFGAFLDSRWRRHDIIWGRLDGAERIIAAALPGDEHAAKRAELIKSAHIAILRDELTGPDRDAVLTLISRLIASGSWTDERVVWEKLAEKAGKDPNAVEQILRAVAADESLYRYFKTSYTLDRTLEPTTVTRLAARATTVVGNMLEDLANKRNLDGHKLSWVTRLGRIFWGAVEVAVPQSIARALFRHLVGVFLLVAVLLIAVGSVFGLAELRRDGIAWFVTATVLLAARAFVERLLHGWKVFKWIGGLLATVAVSALFYFAIEGVRARLGETSFFKITPTWQAVVQQSLILTTIVIVTSIVISERSPVAWITHRFRRGPR